MRKARVVFYLKSLGLGATEKTAELFARELHSKYSNNYDVYVLYNAKGDLSRYLNLAASLPADRLVSYLHDSQGFEKLNWLRPDIVHVFRAGAPESPVSGKDFKQAICVETNVFGFLDPNPEIHKSLFMSSWLLEASKQSYGPIFETLGHRGRFDFVNNPADLPATHEKYDIKTLPDLDHLDDEFVVFGRCGRPDDGIYDDINVKATLYLQAKGHKICFLTMAAPPRMIKDLNQYGIAFYNFEPTVNAVELSKFYNTIDILAHSRADGETFGSNIAEAMIHGKPVVTHVAWPSHPGMGVFQAQTQIVQHKVTGFVTAHNVKEYAEALETLATFPQLRKKFGEAGLDWAVKNCSTEVSVAKLDKIYQDLLTKYTYFLRSRN